MTTLMRCVWLVLLCGMSASALAAVDARLDRDRVGRGETVQLVLQHQGNTDAQPDLEPLKKDFDILGRSSGTSVQFVNGHLSAQVQLRLTLAPKRSGKLQIPALRWDGEQSRPLQLVVDDKAAAGDGADAAAGNAGVFMEYTLDPDRPYVQGAAVLTVRLYIDRQLYQASLDLPQNDDLMVRQLGEDRQLSETRNGRSYQVVERHYLLIPQRSGKLTLDGPVLDAQVADNRVRDPFGDVFGGGNPFAGMMGATRPMRLRGDAIDLDVRPRPAAAQGAGWLPAQALTLTEDWQPETLSVHAGEPLTRRLHLRAVGLSGDQLPDLGAMLPLPDGIKAYPDQPRLDTAVEDGKLVGRRDQDVALIASRPGRYALPELRLNWWDVGAGVQRELVLPAQTLEVLPAAGSSGAAAGGQPAALPAPNPSTAAGAVPPERAAPTAPDSAVPAVEPRSLAVTGIPTPAAGIWPWVSLALAVLWLATLAGWWVQRRRAVAAVPPPDAAMDAAAVALGAANARKAFVQACAANDAPAARRHLLAWAGAVWPDAAPAGLHALARRLGEPQITVLLQQLDRACYAPDGAWQGEALARAIRLERGRVARGHGDALPALYPS
ncbi:MAG: BatD family protein [Nevskiales bacterium]|nr:BatD family protein [Nevskiales bacterium]